MTKERELLRRVYKMLVVFSQGDMLGHDESKALTDIEAYFLTPCDDPETDFGMMDDAEEPVAWMHPSGGVIQKAETRLEKDTYTIPLYLHPPKPAEPEADEDEDEDECEKFLNTKLPFPVKFANGKNGAGTTIRTLLIRLENQNKHVEELIERVKSTAKPAEPEAEPVAWVHCKGDYRVIKSWSITDDYRDRGWTQYPLYLHPPRPEPRRKPMTEEETASTLLPTMSDDYEAGFIAGVRFAEKHHGITE